MFTIPSSYFPLHWHSKILFDEDRVNLVDDTNGEGGLMDGVCEVAIMVATFANMVAEVANKIAEVQIVCVCGIERISVLCGIW